MVPSVANKGLFYWGKDLKQSYFIAFDTEDSRSSISYSMSSVIEDAIYTKRVE